MGFRGELNSLFGLRPQVTFSSDFAQLAGGNVVGAVFAKLGTEEAGRLVFSSSPEYGTIQTINVRDDLQGRGIGRGLYNYFEKWLALRGVSLARAMYVDSPEAERFWHSLGFARTEPSSKDWTKRVRP